MDDLILIDQKSYELGQVEIIKAIIRTLESQLSKLESGNE